MNNSHTSKSGLFLIELILSIFFFIIAMAVCLQLFVKARTLSQDTVSVNQAVLWSQNLAEVFLGNGGDYAQVKDTFSTYDCANMLDSDFDTHLLMLFDRDWAQTQTLADTRYFVFSVYSSDASFGYADIYVLKGAPDSSFTEADVTEKALVHHLQVKKYKGGAAHE